MWSGIPEALYKTSMKIWWKVQNNLGRVPRLEQMNSFITDTSHPYIHAHVHRDIHKRYVETYIEKYIETSIETYRSMYTMYTMYTHTCYT